MTNTNNLKSLKSLAAKPELQQGFSSQEDCINWVNQVAPLLVFNKNLHEQFSAYQKNINTLGLSQTLQGSSLNQMISILRNAIAELENPSKKAIISPVYGIDLDKLTFPALWKSIPVRYWLLFIALLIAAFTAGITFSETKLYKSIKDLASTMPKANNTKVDNIMSTKYK